MVSSGIAVSIGVVSLAYSLLLRHMWQPAGVQFVADELLHDVTPLLYLVWWAWLAPKRGLRWSDPLRWLAYPLAYVAFSAGQGLVSGRGLLCFRDRAASDDDAVPGGGQGVCGCSADPAVAAGDNDSHPAIIQCFR